MKVFFINNGMTHYYNLVLSKLNHAEDVELTLVAPLSVSKDVGDGVYQTTTGASFRVIRLREFTYLGFYHSFRGLARLLIREKPDIVIVNESYLQIFLYNIPVRLIMRCLGIKLILKTIPFRIPTYEDALAQIKHRTKGYAQLPDVINGLLIRSRLIKLVQFIKIRLTRVAFNIPDAYVAYIDDAYDVFGSYGVAKEKIYVVRNSPDTDMLFDIKRTLAEASPVLPVNEHRMIHVGRLVEWKRVDLLISAFSSIKSKFKDAELLVVGTGPQEMDLKALSRKLGVDNDVTFLGGIYDLTLLAQYLMSSSVYVLAGMGGLSINDAMCYGLPIICSVCDGTEKMLVRDEFNGKYFREGDEKDLVEKIEYLFRNPEIRRKMGNNSTEIIRNEINIHTVINGYLAALRYVSHH